MGSARGVLQGMERITPPPSERRLVLKASSKRHRAQFIAAIKDARTPLRVQAALTPMEEANKALLRRKAQAANCKVVDHGDRCFLIHKRGPLQ